MYGAILGAYVVTYITHTWDGACQYAEKARR